jgi:NAD(P)-dependent dehydrogenase (short-subunit alcohol dehydrogenase family)
VPDLAGQRFSTPLDEWRRLLDINLTGQFVCAQAAVRHMMDADRRRPLSDVRRTQLPIAHSTIRFAIEVGGTGQVVASMVGRA